MDTVLLVEDDRFIQKLVSTGLVRSGYQVIQALNGEKAQAIIKDQLPQIIILDLFMPKMDGLGFLNWLRNEHISNIPIIVLSANQKEELIEKAMALGASLYLKKPVHLNTLLKKIRSLLD